jgi:hypothetical protein
MSAPIRVTLTSLCSLCLLLLLCSVALAQSDDASTPAYDAATCAINQNNTLGAEPVVIGDSVWACPPSWMSGVNRQPVGDYAGCRVTLDEYCDRDGDGSADPDQAGSLLRVCGLDTQCYVDWETGEAQGGQIMACGGCESFAEPSEPEPPTVATEPTAEQSAEACWQAENTSLDSPATVYEENQGTCPQSWWAGTEPRPEGDYDGCRVSQEEYCDRDADGVVDADRAGEFVRLCGDEAPCYIEQESFQIKGGLFVQCSACPDRPNVEDDGKSDDGVIDGTDDGVIDGYEGGDEPVDSGEVGSEEKPESGTADGADDGADDGTVDEPQDEIGDSTKDDAELPNRRGQGKGQGQGQGQAGSRPVQLPPTAQRPTAQQPPVSQPPVQQPPATASMPPLGIFFGDFADGGASLQSIADGFVSQGVPATNLTMIYWDDTTSLDALQGQIRPQLDDAMQSWMPGQELYVVGYSTGAWVGMNALLSSGYGDLVTGFVSVGGFLQGMNDVSFFDYMGGFFPQWFTPYGNAWLQLWLAQHQPTWSQWDLLVVYTDTDEFLPTSVQYGVLGARATYVNVPGLGHLDMTDSPAVFDAMVSHYSE